MNIAKYVAQVHSVLSGVTFKSCFFFMLLPSPCTDGHHDARGHKDHGNTSCHGAQRMSKLSEASVLARQKSQVCKSPPNRDIPVIIARAAFLREDDETPVRRGSSKTGMKGPGVDISNLLSSCNSTSYLSETRLSLVILHRNIISFPTCLP